MLIINKPGVIGCKRVIVQVIIIKLKESVKQVWVNELVSMLVGGILSHPWRLFEISTLVMVLVEAIKVIRSLVYRFLELSLCYP